jgi:hypothetical protein
MLGKLFAGPLMLIYWLVGLWGFVLTIQFLYAHVGLLLTFVGLLFFPFTFVAVPIWAGLAEGNWLIAIVSFSPILLVYAMGGIAAILSGIAAIFRK